jgi:putative nucleotidyltransferase-like protein
LSHPSSKIFTPKPRPEIDLLLCCARTRPTLEATNQIRAICEAGIDVEYLIRIAKHHMLVPLVYRNLSTVCPEYVPADALKRLREASDATTKTNLVLSEELVRLLKLFDEHQIPALPFKGPTLAAVAYGDISLRKFGDVDILTQERDVPGVETLLLREGYYLKKKVFEIPLESDWELSYVHGESGVNVDLHWAIMPPYFPVPFDFERLWRRRKPVSLAGQTVSALSDEDLLLILCAHGCKHYWEHLEWLCDVAELTRASHELNWEWLLQEARRLRSRRMFILSLQLARDLLEATIPRHVLQSMHLDAALPALNKQVRRRVFRRFEAQLGFFDRPHTSEDLDIDTVYFLVRVRERLQDRVRFCRWLAEQVLTPGPKERALLSLPDSLSFLYYFLRSIRVVGKLSWMLLQTLGQVFKTTASSQ